MYFCSVLYNPNFSIHTISKLRYLSIPLYVPTFQSVAPVLVQSVPQNAPKRSLEHSKAFPVPNRMSSVHSVL